MKTVPDRSRRGAVAKGCLIVGIVLGLVVLLFGGCVASQYNGIVSKETVVESKLSEIQNQYKRRYDLIPNLVETVKGAADFERSTIVAVTEARASVGRVQLPENLPDDPAKLRAYFAAQDQLGSALARLFAVSENYPQLRATENFLRLLDQIEGTENRIAVARRDYIDSVRDFNVAVRTFPGNVVAGLFGKESLPQLEFEAGVEETPRIDFGGGR
jgi:LemA protein